ncbi:MAG: MFS transporter [Acidimicrobiaceae bacterium]|nr:MFS transporter [Acidimicrobiaceae bacterium]MYE08792.1 MFS transporter [Acidimicrobiaceae bacterium]MYI35173.1 MFS transporter [Acidimicrobiaceae bacterium]
MERVSRSAWLTLAVVSVAVFMVAMELTIIALALPKIREALAGTTPAALSWVVNAYSIVVAALLLLSGWLADRYGRKRVFRTGLALFALGSVAAGASTSIEMLIAARALQAVGGSMQYPAGLALLLDAFPRSRHQTAIGTWGAVGGLAAAVGPALGAVLIEAFGWRAVFYVNVPVALAALVIGARVLPESTLPPARVRSANGPLGPKGKVPAARVDLIGVPLASVGVGAIILGIVQGETWGWASAATVACFAAGALLVAAFAWRSRRHPAPLFDLQLLRIRSFMLGNLGSLFFAIGFFALLVPLPSFIQEVWGWSALETGLAYSAGPLVSFLVAPQAGRLADRIGNAPLLTAGSACGMAGLLWLVLTISTDPSLARLLVATVLVGVSAGTGFSQLVGAALRDIPPERYAMATAGRTTFFQLSVAFAIAVAFAMIGRPDGAAAQLAAYNTVWMVCAGGYLCNFVLFTFIYPRHRFQPVDSKP